MADSNYVVRLNGEDNLSSSVNKAKQSLQDFERVGQTAMQKIDAKFQRIITSSAPLKRQLRDLQQLMADMNFKGLSNTEEFTRIAQTAGQIKDAISDAAAATQRFANDTMTLQAGIQALQGIAGAASAVQGAMALLGTENEDVARSIQKVQGALAILNGVQALANSLNKDSILMQKLKQIRLAATTATTTTNTVATTANTVATTANTAATSASVIVQKVWNVTKAIGKALLGDFSGLLIVGAAALATYAIATGNSSDRQKTLNKETEDGKKLQDMITDARKQSLSAIAEEKNRIEALQRVVDSANTSYEDKVKAINQLKQIIPQYNATISAEGVVHSNAVTAIRNHIAALDDLQKALAAYKVGQQIADKVAQADFDKFLADHKVNAKRQNIAADQREIDKQRARQTPLATLGYDSRTQTNIAQSRELTAAEGRKKINEKNLKIAEEDQRTADIRLKNAQREQEQQKKWQQTQGSIKAQTAVALAGGDVTKAADIFMGRDKPTTTGGGSRGGRGGGGGSNTDRNAQEQTRYQTTLNNLQSQYNDKLIDELTYRTKIRDAEKSHLQHLFNINKATAEDVAKLQKVENELKSAEISINFQSNVADITKQFEDGFINAEQRAEAMADALKTVYLENLKIGTATKEMADAYNQAKQQAELAKQAATLEEDTKTVLNAKYEPQTSSFEQATQGDKQKTWDEQLDAIQNQMDFNDELIVQLQELLNIYQQLGLVGTDSYNAINDKLNETIQANQELGASAVEVSQKQEEWLRKQEMIQGWSDSLSELGGIFSSLSGAVDETTGAWLQFTGQALEGVSKIIPLIQKLVLAKQAEAIASGTAEGAKMPFPANIAAILSIIGVIASVFASLPKFASGGVVGGASRYGDNILARVNSGEMILNASQQSNLWNAIENGELNTLNRFYVDWRLRGADLYGSLKNYGKTQNKTGKGISL